jgi:hypothetical protein
MKYESVQDDVYAEVWPILVCQKKAITNDAKAMPIRVLDPPTLAAEFEVGDEAEAEVELEPETVPEVAAVLVESIEEATGALPAFSLNAAAV